MMRIISFVIIPLLLVGCFTTKEDRQSRRYFKKEIRKENVLLHAYREGVASSEVHFTLRENNKFAYTSFFWGDIYYVGDWELSNNLDTVFLSFLNNHGNQEIGTYCVIDLERDSFSRLNSLGFLEFWRVADTIARYKLKISSIDSTYIINN